MQVVRIHNYCNFCSLDMHENRETSRVSRSHWDRGRSEKVQSRTSDMHALEGSDRAVLCAEQHVVQEG